MCESIKGSHWVITILSLGNNLVITRWLKWVYLVSDPWRSPLVMGYKQYFRMFLACKEAYLIW